MAVNCIKHQEVFHLLVRLTIGSRQQCLILIIMYMSEDDNDIEIIAFFDYQHRYTIIFPTQPCSPS